MGSIYIFVILLIRIVQHLFGKRVSDLITDMRTYMNYSTFTMIISSLGGLALILFGGGKIEIDFVTILISIFSGLMICASSCFSNFAMHSGSMAISSMFSTAGVIIPCLFGIFLFGIPISFFAWCGIALFLVSTYFLVSDSKSECRQFSMKTGFLLLGSLLSNGFTMLAQQMFTYYRPEADVAVFSFLTFATVAIVELVALPFVNGGKVSNMKMPSKLYIYGFILALAVFFINQFATAATSLVAPAVLFTFINGGSTIIAAIIGFLCFKEKLTPKKILGILIGVVALVIIKAF